MQHSKQNNKKIKFKGIIVGVFYIIDNTRAANSCVSVGECKGNEMQQERMKTYTNCNKK